MAEQQSKRRKEGEDEYPSYGQYPTYGGPATYAPQGQSQTQQQQYAGYGAPGYPPSFVGGQFFPPQAATQSVPQYQPSQYSSQQMYNPQPQQSQPQPSQSQSQLSQQAQMADPQQLAAFLQSLAQNPNNGNNPEMFQQLVAVQQQLLQQMIMQQGGMGSMNGNMLQMAAQMFLQPQQAQQPQPQKPVTQPRTQQSSKHPTSSSSQHFPSTSDGRPNTSSPLQYYPTSSSGNVFLPLNSSTMDGGPSHRASSVSSLGGNSASLSNQHNSKQKEALPPMLRTSQDQYVLMQKDRMEPLPHDISSATTDVDPLVQAIVDDYLLSKTPRDLSITILNSRVVQKSYGSEKRFFCPPPCVVLNGDGWFQPKHGELIVFVGIGDLANKELLARLELDGNAGLARTLYISDQDKRKSFCLQVKIFFSTGKDVGTFISRPIKVISKPSKTKQASPTDLCIELGTEVSLFSRVRVQSGAARYMHTNHAGLCSSPRMWSSFLLGHPETIHETKKYSQAPEIFRYGMEVVLKCVTTNYVTPVLIPRKIEKKVIDLSGNEAISQLQKLAFYVKGSDGLYLCLDDLNEQIVQARALPDPDNPSQEIVPESCAWTISSTDCIRYTFYIPPSLVDSDAVPNPVPVVTRVKTLGPLVELYGENFNACLTVFLDGQPIPTFYRCEELIACKPPKRAPSPNPLSVDILLVRRDGVIFRTGHTYTFEVDIMAALAIKREKELLQQQQFLQQKNHEEDLS